MTSEGASKTQVNSNLEERSLTMERVFDAPRELVFRAYTEPEILKHWWGPQGWTLPVCNVDLREGGRWHYCMKGPGGEESWGLATYQEISPPERIVYRDAFSDAEGNVNADLPEMIITVEFIDEGGKTRLRSRTLFDTQEALQSVLDMGVIEGMTETLDRLEDYLARA